MASQELDPLAYWMEPLLGRTVDRVPDDLAAPFTQAHGQFLLSVDFMPQHHGNTPYLLSWTSLSSRRALSIESVFTSLPGKHSLLTRCQLRSLLVHESSLTAPRWPKSSISFCYVCPPCPHVSSVAIFPFPCNCWLHASLPIWLELFEWSVFFLPCFTGA